MDIKKVVSPIKNKYLITIYLVCAFLSACVNTDPTGTAAPDQEVDVLPPATPIPTLDDAIIARDTLAKEQVRLKELEAQLSSAIKSLEVIPVLKLIIQEPLVLPIQIFYRQYIETQYGEFTETTKGVFEFTSAPVPSDIVVKQLNGQVIEVTEITYLDTDNSLASFRLKAYSSAQPPAADQISIDAVFEKLTALGGGGLIPSSTTALTSVLQTTGTATFPTKDPVAPTVIAFKRTIGSREEAGSTGQSHRYYRNFSADVLSNNIENGKSYRAEHVVQSVPSDQPGIWVTAGMFDVFQGDEIDYIYRLVMDTMVNGIATYLPQGSVHRNNMEVAQIIGGPYSCNITIPATDGFGTSIDRNWLDGISESLFPGEKNCTNMFVSVMQ